MSNKQHSTTITLPRGATNLLIRSILQQVATAQISKVRTILIITS